MKHFLFCILAVVAMLAMVAAMNQEEDEDEEEEDGNDDEDYLNELIAECQMLENTTDDDVLLLRQEQKPMSAEAKCLTGCLYERITFLMNGKLCKVNADYVCEEVSGTMKLKATNEECIKRARGFDKCEDGSLLLACMLKYDPDYKIFPSE